jgi:hypothetical protein
VSGSRPTPVEQHLGDRLASFVDGELSHDARDRVLAHLATCPRCKAEADAQRRLKTAFAQAAPPPLSESFLARLQGLPGGGLPGGPSGPGGPGSGLPVFESGGDPFAFAPTLTPTSPGDPLGRPAPSGAGAPGASGSGFRIHPVGRPDTERSAARGRRRFAFAAAGAVSLAAIALGGVTTVTAPVDGGDARGPSSNNVTPLRTQGNAVPAGDAPRRRSATPMLGQRTGGALAGPVAPAPAAAPLLPGAPWSHLRPMEAVQALAAPLLAGASVTSGLLHPVPPVTGPLTDPRPLAPLAPLVRAGEGATRAFGDPASDGHRSPRTDAPAPSPHPEPAHAQAPEATR